MSLTWFRQGVKILLMRIRRSFPNKKVRATLNPHSRSAALLLVILLAACGRPPAAPTSAAPTSVAAPASASTTPSVTITGGYDTDPRDGGRPVVLIAAALGVPPEGFREAFSHVQPAAAGQEQNPTKLGLKKAAFFRVLAPYGIPNDARDGF